MDATVRAAVARQYLEPGNERYSGESVLDEFARLDQVAPAEVRQVMIRYLAAQYFTNRLRGDWAERLLRIQRSAALNAIGTGLVLDREQRLLRRALELDDPQAACQGTVISLLATAAERAEERGHAAGAVALARIAYEAALTDQLWLVAAGAAERIARLLDVEHVAARRRWRRRARSLARRGETAEEPAGGGEDA